MSNGWKENDKMKSWMLGRGERERVRHSARATVAKMSHFLATQSKRSKTRISHPRSMCYWNSPRARSFLLILRKAIPPPLTHSLTNTNTSGRPSSLRLNCGRKMSIYVTLDCSLISALFFHFPDRFASFLASFFDPCRFFQPSTAILLFLFHPWIMTKSVELHFHQPFFFFLFLYL